MTSLETESSMSLEWFDVVVVLSALVDRMNALTRQLELADPDTDVYDMERLLSDYQNVARKLNERYAEYANQGRLPEGLARQIQHTLPLALEEAFRFERTVPTTPESA